MGLFELFKHPKREESLKVPPVPKDSYSNSVRGDTKIEYIKLTRGKLNRINRFFIAFDLETTGLSPETDRMIEIGAVAFINGQPADEFTTLVNPGRPIPPSSIAVHGITDAMVKNSPDEKTAVLSLLSFFDKYADNELIFVGHNANFDFSFLKNSLNRLGITRQFKYFDTLYASRSLVKGLENYKQNTVANHFGIVNEQAHRSLSDALTCGRILLKLAPISKKDPNEFVLEPKNIPTREEMAVCAYIQKLILNSGGRIEDLTYYKNSGGYVTIDALYEVARFKFAKKGRYLIIDKSSLGSFENPREDCTTSEGGTAFSRAFFIHPAQLDCLQEYFFDKYNSACKSRDFLFETSPLDKDRYMAQFPDMLQLSTQTMNLLIDELDAGTLNKIPVIKREQEITRDMVEIDVEVTRKPLSKIRNRNNWDRGYDQGFPYFERAEIKRKLGSEQDVLEAIGLLDQARENGFFALSLYDSYAKAYRKLKDYQNEILICEEGISRLSPEESHICTGYRYDSSEAGALRARRNKAIQLLYKQQNPKGRR